eukprot:scaffold99964_cov18-Phaeocystis_antarctica.AAC.1
MPHSDLGARGGRGALLTTHYLLLTTQLTTHYSLLTTYHLPLRRTRRGRRSWMGSGSPQRAASRPAGSGSARTRLAVIRTTTT